MPGEAPRELGTTRALEALPSGAWREMHQVRWPSRLMTNLDHIVVGRAGVFLIDSRDWSGQIEVSSQGLTQDGFNREATLARLVEAAVAVAKQLPGLDPRHVVPVLCFDSDEPVWAWVGDVLVCTTANVVDLLVTQRRVFAADKVDDLFNVLKWLLPSGSYRIGEPSGPSRPGHRRDGRSRRRLAWRRRSSAKHAPSSGMRSSPGMRGALVAVVACLVLFSLVRYVAGPVANWAVAMATSLW
jgi:hypothetical protein